jgi:hypothetical protein
VRRQYKGHLSKQGGEVVIHHHALGIQLKEGKEGRGKKRRNTGRKEGKSA